MRDLSIIIPIYNTPIDTLQRCFMSILPMAQVDYEVLLIDDGSAEEVGVYCKEFAEKHPVFQYHYKENGGVSSARNLGLSLATGRYVTFVDADDAIYADVLAENVPADDTQDLVLFDILLTQGGNDSVWYAFDLPEGNLVREQILNQLLTASSISGPVAKLYRTALIRQASIAFNTRFVAGEDWMFVCDYVMQAQQFYYCRKSVYRYFLTNATGLSRMIRFPDTMLSNQLERYEKKQEILKNCRWQSYDPVEIASLAAVELTENLFNSAADLWMNKQYTLQRKQLIRDAVEAASAQFNGGIAKKTKLKQWVLTSCPVALYPLAILRALYLKKK